MGIEISQQLVKWVIFDDLKSVLSKCEAINESSRYDFLHDCEAHHNFIEKKHQEILHLIALAIKDIEEKINDKSILKKIYAVQVFAEFFSEDIFTYCVDDDTKISIFKDLVTDVMNDIRRI